MTQQAGPWSQAKARALDLSPENMSTIYSLVMARAHELKRTRFEGDLGKGLVAAVDELAPTLQPVGQISSQALRFAMSSWANSQRKQARNGRSIKLDPDKPAVVGVVLSQPAEPEPVVEQVVVEQPEPRLEQPAAQEQEAEPKPNNFLEQPQEARAYPALSRNGAPSLTTLYREWCMTHDWVPEDSVFIHFMGYHVSAPSYARRMLTEEGFKFEREEHTWHVDNPQRARIQALEEQIAALRQELAGLVKGSRTRKAYHRKD